MTPRPLLCVIACLLLSGCAGTATGHIKDRQADDNYAKSADLSSQPIVSKAKKESAMFPVAQLPKQPIVSPSLLPPGSLMKRLVQDTKKVEMDLSSPILIEYAIGKAWDKVGHALDKAGYRVLAEDKKLGVYFVWQGAQGGKHANASPVYQIQLSKHDKHSTQINLSDEQNHHLDASKYEAIASVVKRIVA